MSKPVATPVNPIATVVSDSKPQSGQRHRSSGNFSTETTQQPPQLQWFVTDNSQSSSVTFDVMEDNSLGRDPTVFAGVKNGTITNYVSSRALYIANPANDGGNGFGVQAWPYGL